MRVIKVLFALTILTAVLPMIASCGGKVSTTVPPSWNRVDPANRQYSSALGFSAILPAYWMALEDPASRTLLVTRHSLPMGFIHIRRVPLSTPLPNTGLMLYPNMHTYEAAEVVIHNLRAGQGVYDLTVEELAPYEIDGREAFSMMMLYSMENGMRRRCLIYGFIDGADGYYTEVGLYALEEYYFGAALGDFLALVSSFKVEKY
jgi:hypothetical protein